MKQLIQKISNFLQRIFSPLLRISIFAKIAELLSVRNIRTKVFFTIGIILLYRFLANVPPPGIDVRAFTDVFANNPLTNIFTLATGGSLDNPSLVMIGLGPYINASIIISLLTTVIPKLEQLSKEGARGRQVISQYTRFLTIPLAIMQAVVVYLLLSRSAGLVTSNLNLDVIAFIAAIAAGSMFLMWLAENITENGVGNGSSMIIAFSIISSLPSLILTDIQGVLPLIQAYQTGTITLGELLTSQPMIFVYALIVGIVLLVMLMVLMNEGLRKITIQYARRIAGQQSNYLPIRVNQAGVMPIIFASAILTFPTIIAQLVQRFGGRWEATANSINNSFLSDFNSVEYNLVYFVLIIAFTFFYTFIIFKPNDTADNLKKSGGFIPGIRPGKQTEQFLTSVMIKMAVIGAIFLAIIGIMPAFARLYVNDTAQIGIISGIGGTSLLIIVSVIVTTYRQIVAMKVTRSYDRYR